MKVPNMVPTPPVKAHPPSIAAVTPSNSNPTQAEGCPEFIRAANKTPAMAANEPEMICSLNTIVFGVSPARRAAYAFPHKTYTLLPKYVFDRT